MAAQRSAQKAAYKAQRDLYRQQTRAMRRSSILGPVLVVAFGVIALLVKLGKIPLLTFTLWYGRWWPLLLVCAGLVMMLEWAFDQRTRTDGVPHLRRGIGGGAVFLLVLLGLTGLAASGVHDGNDFLMHGFSINPDNLDQIFGERHDYTQQIDQSFAPATALDLDNPHGDITLAGTSTDGMIHITVSKHVYGRSDGDAASKEQRISPAVSLSGTTLNVTVPSVDGATADLAITLPSTAAATINSNHGDLMVSGMAAPVIVTSNHGDVEVNAITGAVVAHVNHSGSSFSAHEVTGDVSVNGHAQDLNVSGIGGQVTLEGDFYGDTHLEHIKGPVRFETSKTHFTLGRLDGEVNINRSELSGDQIVGPTELHTHSRTISFERVAGDLDVSNSNGPVEISGSAPIGAVTIENTSGAVHVTVPGDAGFDVQAETKGGDIEDDFNMQPTKINDRSNLQGTVGHGNGRVNIKTTHADIELRRGVVEAPVAPAPEASPTAKKPKV